MFGMCVFVENWPPTAPPACVCVCIYTCIICVCTELVDTGLVVCRKGMGEDMLSFGAEFSSYIFIYDCTSSNCACSRITRFFLSEKISKFFCLS